MKESETSVKFFRRTSTHVVLDSIFNANDSFEKIRADLQNRGHRRKDHDIKYMIGAIQRLGIIENHQPTEFGEKINAFIQSVQHIQTANGNSTPHPANNLLKITGK